MTTSIRPTIGRIVLFHPDRNSAEAGFSRHNDGQPYAAIIARVWNDSLVNLSVIDANGYSHSRTSVPLLQGDAGAPGVGFYCEWMSFQKDQAAKADGPNAWREPTQRDNLEYALVSGASAYLAAHAQQAILVAEGIQTVLDKLHPPAVAAISSAGAALDSHSIASETAATSIKLPVIDPGADSLEREIQAKANNAPRVTPADIEAEIVSVHYFVASDAIRHENAVHEHKDGWKLGGTQLLTFCVIQMSNGFTVTGESACASAENYSAEIGRSIARENAVNKIWPLMGFRLRDKLAQST